MIAVSFLESSLNSWYADAMLRLLVAAVLGSLVGIEREIHGRSAGFRTQLLVALGSSLAMIVSLHFARQFASSDPGALAIRVDPARVAYGVMGGVGFLGAGVIMRRETGVKGLTTAASLWCTAAVGLACGFGMYIVAVFAAILVVFSLTVLNRLDKWLPTRASRIMVASLPASDADNVERLRQALATRRMHVKDIDYERDFQTNVETITLDVSLPLGVDDAQLRTVSKDIPELIKLIIR
jgi:putative Mg2+ transporter-C (MgtC) family protein